MFKVQACLTLECDGCGEPLGDDYTVHFDDQQMALDEAREHEWQVLRDGRVFCQATSCALKVPACACVDEDDCDRDDGDSCPVGCPCLLHGEPRPGGPCAEAGCGESFDNRARLYWHQLSKHPKPDRGAGSTS